MALEAALDTTRDGMQPAMTSGICKGGFIVHLHELQFSNDTGLAFALEQLHRYHWVETCIVKGATHHVQFSAPAERIGMLLNRLTSSGQLVDWQFSSVALAS